LGGNGVEFAALSVRGRVRPFQVRPATRAEIRAPVAGFLQAVHFVEGERVSEGTLVARLDVPNLASRLAQKQAQVRETQAKLRLLEIGPRPEEVAEQRLRVSRMAHWRDLADNQQTPKTARRMTKALARHR
jgi:putative peptide zinc metalloprotease protein